MYFPVSVLIIFSALYGLDVIEYWCSVRLPSDLSGLMGTWKMTNALISQQWLA